MGNRETGIACGGIPVFLQNSAEAVEKKADARHSRGAKQRKRVGGGGGPRAPVRATLSQNETGKRLFGHDGV